MLPFVLRARARTVLAEVSIVGPKRVHLALLAAPVPVAVHGSFVSACLHRARTRRASLLQSLPSRRHFWHLVARSQAHEPDQGRRQRVGVGGSESRGDSTAPDLPGFCREGCGRSCRRSPRRPWTMTSRSPRGTCSETNAARARSARCLCARSCSPPLCVCARTRVAYVRASPRRDD